MVGVTVYIGAIQLGNSKRGVADIAIIQALPGNIAGGLGIFQAKGGYPQSVTRVFVKKLLSKYDV